VQVTGSVRTETLNLQLEGTRIGILSEVPEATALLRSSLADHLIDDPADIGFVLQEPSRPGGLYILIDRSGFVLGRTRLVDDCVAILGSHLAAFMPRPAGTLRVRMRALLRDDVVATLAGFPVFETPPVIERRLEQLGYNIVDRLAVDLYPDGTLAMSPTPWPVLARLHDVGGHSPAPDVRVPVTATLIPQLGSFEQSQATLVSFVAGTVDADSRDHTLDLAERLAQDAVLVDLNDRSARYDVLRRA